MATKKLEPCEGGKSDPKLYAEVALLVHDILLQSIDDLNINQLNSDDRRSRDRKAFITNQK